MSKIGTTATIEVITDEGRIRISSLLKEDGIPDKEWTWLTFYKDGRLEKEVESWDNPDYLKKLYKNLFHRKYSAEEVKEFKEFCAENDFGFHDMEAQYIEVFDAAKKLKMF